VPVGEFVKGMAETAMNENEMAVAVKIPEPPQNSVSGFARHLGDGSEFSIVNVAALVATERSGKRKTRLAYGGIATTPIRAKGAEEILASNGPPSELIKKAVGWVSENVTTIDDNLATAEYRKHMMEVLTYRVLGKLMRGEQN
jgi:CO/xanthine dehydrogenase FAD-binding subunit